MLDGAPDADDAGRRFDRIAEAGAWENELSDDEIQVLSIACGRAPYLATLLARDPTRLQRVAADPHLRREKPRPESAANLADAITISQDMNAALRRMGYESHEMTTHGFRSMASTLLNELGWNRDAIERQLAHSERNSIRAAYNYAEHLPLRRQMMQAWADYLDGLRERGLVHPNCHAATASASG